MLAVWGFFVVGTLDNIIRAYILQSDAKLHPLLAFISVLGGIQAMGLWGVFIAPIIASCLHALIEIFNSELKEISKSQVRRVEPEVGNEENSLPLTAKPEPKAG
jgi:predicted PurR-regulated permease PerM